MLAHSAVCNLGRTKDGVRSGGERLADEVYLSGLHALRHIL